ncbi:hypothetical protein K3495_g5095 [Podosphaera aphanis]|nr:hypothetical protein K3495_g5095 [Podosphaera aphanis]
MRPRNRRPAAATDPLCPERILVAAAPALLWSSCTSRPPPPPTRAAGDAGRAMRHDRLTAPPPRLSLREAAGRADH